MLIILWPFNNLPSFAYNLNSKPLFKFIYFFMVSNPILLLPGATTTFCRLLPLFTLMTPGLNSLHDPLQSILSYPLHPFPSTYALFFPFTTDVRFWIIDRTRLNTRAHLFFFCPASCRLLSILLNFRSDPLLPASACPRLSLLHCLPPSTLLILSL